MVTEIKTPPASAEGPLPAKEATSPPTPQPIALSSPQEKGTISSLSLASIRKKKQWEQNKKETATANTPQAKEAFTASDLQTHWKAYQTKKEKQQERNIAALFQLSTPELKEDHSIVYRVPSDLNKLEMEREFQYFLPYLREALQNFSITINVVVDEIEEKNFVYTPEEKYNRLREINPHIDLLRKKLDLDY